MLINLHSLFDADKFASLQVYKNVRDVDKFVIFLSLLVVFDTDKFVSL